MPDVNVLLYAFRADSTHHRQAKHWLEEQINLPGPFGVSPQALCSVIRIATSARVFATPSTLTEATRFCDAILDAPNCVVVSPGPLHWGLFTDLCKSHALTGNAAQDAWWAALAIEAGCEWISYDKDFRRFKGLRWRQPSE